MEDNEEIYDEVIAPKLMEICELCKDKAIPFLAAVEYAPGEIGETRLMVPGECLKMVMVQHCLKTAPNIDAYVIGIARYARENGIDTSASMVMNQLTQG